MTPVLQSSLETPPDRRKICRDEYGRMTICRGAVTAREVDDRFLRAILIGRIGILANSLKFILPDYTYVFGDSWTPQTGWLNLLSRLQVEVTLDFTPFTSIGGLTVPITGVYSVLGQPLVVLDENDNILPFWDEGPMLWVKLPDDAVGPTYRLYVAQDPILYRPEYDSPDNLFTFFDSFEVWSGWQNLQSGVCRQVCDGAWHGHCYLDKEVNCDPNGCFKQMGLTVDRASTPFAVEVWFYRPNSGSDCPADRVTVADPNGNGYEILVNMFNASLSIGRRSSWRATGIASGQLSRGIIGDWYFARLSLYPDGTIIAEVYDKNHNLLGSITARDTTYNRFTTLAVQGGRPYHVDALRIRRLLWQDQTYFREPSATLSGKQVYVYPIEFGEPIQAFTATIDVDNLIKAEYSIDGGKTWIEFTTETVIDLSQVQPTSIALRFTVEGDVRAWAMLVKTAGG